MIPYLCLWETVGRILIRPLLQLMYGCLYKWMEQKYPIPEYLASMGHQEAKPADALNKGKKFVRGMEVQSKGDVLEIAFKGTHAAIVGETNPHADMPK